MSNILNYIDTTIKASSFISSGDILLKRIVTNSSGQIAIGNYSGYTNQGQYSIAIGNQAGQTNQPSNSIILNANSSDFSTATQSNSLYINPIRKDNSSISKNLMYYNPNTKELTYSDINYSQLITISQKVCGETIKKDIVPYNLRKSTIKNSNIDFTTDNYIDNTQEYTFGRSSQNLWIAVGSGTNTIAYSTNGKNWIGLGTNIFSTKGNGIAWNGNMWVAVGSGTNSIAYSYNGLNWFPSYNSLNIFSFEGICITWNGTLWIAGGSGINNTIAYSYDGINWIGLGFIFQDYCRKVEWNGNTFVAVGGGISKAIFTGGFQTLGTIKSVQIFKPICCSSSGQYQYCVNCNNNNSITITQLYRSIDYGNNWNSIGAATSGTTYMQSICCSRDGRNVYFGLSPSTEATVVVSNDYGVTLTTKTIPSVSSSSGEWLCCSGDGRYVYVIGEAFFTKSSDYGSTFTTASGTITVSGTSTSLTNSLRGIACSIDGKYVILLRSSTTIGAVFVSSDFGLTWINSQNTTFINISNRSCCMSTSGQYMFVTPITNSGSYISKDYGISWIKTTLNVTGVASCCSDDFRYILSADNQSSRIYYSSDYGSTFTDITDSPLAISYGYDSVCCSSDFSYIHYTVNGTIYNRQLLSLNVTNISSGIIDTGMILSGSGIGSNIRISSFQSGVNGSLGSYILNNFPYFSSTTITGTSTSIAYSTDGLNWTNNMTTVLSNQGNGVGWNGNMWLVTGVGSSVFAGTISSIIQPILTVTSVSYGSLYNGLNISGTRINSNTYISNGNIPFTGSISGTTLTVTSTTGVISIGMLISGNGIAIGTLIKAFISGTNGGLGIYTVSISQITSSTIITGISQGTGTTGSYYLTTTQNVSSSNFTTGGSITCIGTISLTTLTITSISTSSGIISIGMILTGGTISANTYITGYISGTNGGIGTYTVSNSQTVSSTTITGTLTTTFTLNAAINSSNILIANAPSVGIIYLGMIVTGGTMSANTYIMGYGTGRGGEGSYILSNNVSVPISTTITGNFSTSSFTGSISGTRLNISSITGTLYVGSILTTGNCLSSTYITSFISGANGGIGVYTVNTLQSIPSTTITSTGLSTASNTMAYSSDAITWTTLSPNIFTEGYGVSWNGKMWVVGGTGTTSSIIYSYDGLYWFGLGTNIFSKCYNLFWNGCKWMACGESTNKLAFANVDGTNWKAISNSPFSTNCIDIAYNYKKENRITIPKNMFILGGESISNANTLYYSYDSVNWTGLGKSLFTTKCNSVDWNGNIWVAVGLGTTNSLAYSYDGINWTGMGINIFREGVFVKWNGNMWIAGGQNSSSAGIIAYSYDGTTWITSSMSLFNTAVKILEWNGNLWIAGGTGSINTLAYSTDGINWTGLGNSIFSSFCSAVKWNGKFFIAGGNGTNTLAYSTDGIIWTGLGQTVFTLNCFAIDWNENIFVAGGNGTNILAYSADGIIWTGLGTTVFTANCFAIHWNGTYWITGGNGVHATAYSSNGINWTTTGVTFFDQSGRCSSSTRKIGSTYIQHPLVSVGSGSNHTLGYSSNDGLTWSGLGKNMFPLKGNSSCWNGKIWVAGGVSNSVSFLSSIQNNTSLNVTEILSDYPTLTPTVSAWGTYVQATLANQPTFDLNSLNFNGGISTSTTSSFLSLPIVNLSVNTNGGFTAIIYIKFTGTAAVSERFFDFSSVASGVANGIFCYRVGTSQNIIFRMFNSGAEVISFTTSGTEIIQNQWMTVGFRYTKGATSLTSSIQIYKNKLITTGTTSINSYPNDYSSLQYNYIGKSAFGGTDSYFTGSIGGFLVYDRSLSDTELNIATDALVNKTLNFSTTNLVVRLLIMNPTTSLIYPNMNVNGTGITQNTKILGGTSSGRNGNYLITSSSNVSTGIVNASSPSLAYSYDGLNWTGMGNSIFSNTCNNITWTGSQFVVVGEGLVSFIGSISGTILTITSILNGTIYIGMILYGTGITTNTKILSFGTGIGGVGTYNVDISQTVSSLNINGTPITVAYSADGINWTPTQNQIQSGGDCVIYDGKKAVVTGTGFVSFIGRIDNGTGASGTTLTVSEILYDYPIINSITNQTVSRWNTFSQTNSSNQPTFDSNSVNFNGGTNTSTTSAFLRVPKLNLNITTNGGFTAILYLKFTGTTSVDERIFDFGKGQGNDEVVLYKGSDSRYGFFIYNASSILEVNIGSIQTITRNIWHTVSVRYTYSSNTIQIYINKSLTNTNTSVPQISNKLGLNLNYIGKSNSVDPYFTGSIGGVLIYDRALSDTELNTATDALVNKTLNFSTTNLQVRLLIMNPNTSLIYQGMTLTGYGITTGTTIQSYITGSGGIGTYTVSASQNVSPTLINGSNVNISSSSDLVTWTSGTITNLPTISINGIYYNGISYVAVGSGTNTISYSSNLSTWTSVTNLPFTIQGNGILWNGRMWVAVGSGTNTIAYSSDGISWNFVSNSSSIFPLNSNSISWTGKKWIASGPVNTCSFTGTIDGTNLTVSGFTNFPLTLIGMIITGTGVASGSKIISGTSSPYTINISQSVSSTTIIGRTNAIAYSYDGINWSDMVSTVFSSQCNGVIGNSRSGTTIVDSQLVIDVNGNGLSDSVELISDKYYNTDYNTFSVSIVSNMI